MVLKSVANHFYRVGGTVNKKKSQNFVLVELILILGRAYYFTISGKADRKINKVSPNSCNSEFHTPDGPLHSNRNHGNKKIYVVNCMEALWKSTKTYNAQALTDLL